MWIDRITEFEADRRMAAIKAVSAAEEHMDDHFPMQGELPPEGIMPASLVIEGMAQTAGILVGTVNRFREKVVLAKVTRAELEVDFRCGDVLRHVAVIERIDAAGASCSGVVERLDVLGSGPPEEVGRIDLMFAHADRNLAGTEFPEENFVFGENLRGILRTAGLDSMLDD